MLKRSLISIATSVILLTNTSYANDFEILQQKYDKPVFINDSESNIDYYVPSTLETITWGYLPNKTSKPILSIPSGSVVTFDTISHEGLLEDQGRDAEKYFNSKGVKSSEVLNDAKAITDSTLDHDFHKDGPHIVTGPIEIMGAEPGDILKVEVISVEPRVPYGVISNRHGKGALPGEYPEKPQLDNPSEHHPERYGNVSIFTPIERKSDGSYEGILATESGKSIRFPLHPFMGLMGVAANTTEPVHSVPPANYGGNMDINELGAGSTIYYPVQVPGALFYTGDSHFAQGDGEVALTALEASARATFKLTLLKSGIDDVPGNTPNQPIAETAEFWITPGLDEDLDEAMKKSVRESIRFLKEKYSIDGATALAYLSAATDFEVSQVVDKTKGVHGLIRKSDFKEFE